MNRVPKYPTKADEAFYYYYYLQKKLFIIITSLDLDENFGWNVLDLQIYPHIGMC